MIKKRYIIGILLAFFMVIAVASAVDDVSAAKKYKEIDSDSKNFGNGVIAKWTAYHNGKTVKATYTYYIENPKTKKKIKYAYMKFTMKKTSSTKLRTTMTYAMVGSKPKTDKFVDKTRLSAKSFYTKKVRKAFKAGL